ncbi:MAG: hypothetical protein KC457_18540, partial [Myxococcales bacterium]|nr:hypothetical protein [Myxococcales bacterium]
MTRSLSAILLVLPPVLMGWATGCQQDQNQNIPNRVLDRPTDVVLVCADRLCEDLDGDGSKETCQAVMQPLDVCSLDTGSCGSDNPHVIGFVANSERNEVAMFTKCANRLVDLDVETPGYNFVPTGILPTSLAATSNGCRVYSANVGSCDLSLIDAQGLAPYGISLDPAQDEPSTLVSQILPRRFDELAGIWRPLGARPGEIIAVPTSLSTAPQIEPGTTLDPNCDPRSSGSVYVSFPTCNLVAEIDVLSGNILQSRQFVADDEGGITLVDTGLSPACPVECPAQFVDGLPGDLPSVDQDGPFPQALQLLVPPTLPDGAENEPAYDGERAIDSRSLFVGGLGSDTLIEIGIDEDGQWRPQNNALTLADSGGIKRIRISPAATRSGGLPGGTSKYIQFLYVVAGDGSTRVVGR